MKYLKAICLLLAMSIGGAVLSYLMSSSVSPWAGAWGAMLGWAFSGETQ